MVMKLGQGETLNEVVKECGKANEEKAMEMCRALLESAHSSARLGLNVLGCTRAKSLVADHDLTMESRKDLVTMLQATLASVVSNVTALDYQD